MRLTNLAVVAIAGVKIFLLDLRAVGKRMFVHTIDAVSYQLVASDFRACHIRTRHVGHNLPSSAKPISGD